MRRRTKVKTPDATINLTSMMDITFVLLIAFMVVAPALRYNVDLELPQVGEGETTKEQKPVTIQVRAGNEGGAPEVLVNGEITDSEGLATRIKSLDEYTPDTTISFEADRRVEWNHVARLINHLKANGIDKLAIITEQGG